MAIKDNRSIECGDKKAPVKTGAFSAFMKRDLYPASMASSKIATMLMILIIGLIAGPAVSL